MIALPVDAAAFLPHTRTARLLTRILTCAEGVIEARGAVPAGHPLARDGRVPAFLAVELGAQAAAALESLGEAGGGRGVAQAAGGRLVRVREARLWRADVEVETPLHVVARQVGAAPPLAIYRIEIGVADGPVLDGVISTWSDRDGAAGS